jgi:hypothetical protein
MTDLDRSLLGRIGAYRMHSRYDARETTKAGRAAFLARFEREVDPDGVLDPEERAVRAAAARRAYMLDLSLKSAKARRKRSARRQRAHPGWPSSG